MDGFGEFKCFGEGCVGPPGVNMWGNGENDCTEAEEFCHGVLMSSSGGRGDV